MTKIEELQLDPTKLYRFHLYYGISKIGYLTEKNEQLYIVRPTSSNRDVPIEKLGFPIKREQIEKHEEISSSERLLNNAGGIVIENVPNSKILVIFGAGASKDYSFENISENKKPPLAKELFSDEYERILKNYPGAESLSSQILQAKDIEDYFQTQWNKVLKTKNSELLAKLINIQYYLSTLFIQISYQSNNIRKNNYVGFVQHLHDFLVEQGDEKALLLTFNYDTILENSLKTVYNYNFESLNDYIDHRNRFLLFKPHGSCNWKKRFNKEYTEKFDPIINSSKTSQSSFIYNQKDSLAFINERLEKDIYVSNDSPFNNYEFPQILIPYKDKDDFVMPETHTLLLESCLRTVQTIIIIGWKGSEQKFKEVLKKEIGDRGVYVIYVTLGDTSVEKELRGALPRAIFSEFKPEQDSKGTFTEFVKFLNQYSNDIFTKGRS